MVGCVGADACANPQWYCSDVDSRSRSRSRCGERLRDRSLSRRALDRESDDADLERLRGCDDLDLEE